MERTFEVMTPQAEEIEMLYSNKGMTTYSLYNKSLFMEMVSSTDRMNMPMVFCKSMPAQVSA